MKRSQIKRGTSKLSRKRIISKTFDQKTDPKKLETVLDRLIFDFVLARDRRCVQCGSSDNLTPGHVFGRRVRLTRWSPLNVHLQCVFCNSRHEENRHPFYNRVKEIIGSDAFDNLREDWYSPVKLSISDKLEIRNKLEGELKCLAQNE